MNKLTPKQISKYSKIIIKTHNGIHEKNLPLKSDMIKYILSGHDDLHSVKRFEYFDEEDEIAKCMMTYLMDERMSIFFDYIKLTEAGCVWTSGDGQFGKLGHGNDKLQLTLKIVNILEGPDLCACPWLLQAVTTVWL